MAESIEPGFYDGVKALNVSPTSHRHPVASAHNSSDNHLIGPHVRRCRRQEPPAARSRWQKPVAKAMDVLHDPIAAAPEGPVDVGR